MRSTALLFAGLAGIQLLAGCDSLFAKPRVTRWLSSESLLGLVVDENGDEITGELYLFDDAMTMPDPKEVGEGDRLGGLPFAAGIVDTETKCLVFPLQTNTLVHSNSARLLRENGAEYVEFDLDFTRDKVVGRWREGAKPPKLTRTFVRCGPGTAAPSGEAGKVPQDP